MEGCKYPKKKTFPSRKQDPYPTKRETDREYVDRSQEGRMELFSKDPIRVVDWIP